MNQKTLIKIKENNNINLNLFEAITLNEELTIYLNSDSSINNVIEILYDKVDDDDLLDIYSDYMQNSNLDTDEYIYKMEELNDYIKELDLCGSAIINEFKDVNANDKYFTYSCYKGNYYSFNNLELNYQHIKSMAKYILQYGVNNSRMIELLKEVL